jgi:hypothetical protein
MSDNLCPVCLCKHGVSRSNSGDRFLVRCPNCGPFEVSGTFNAQLQDWDSDSDRALLAHAIWRMSKTPSPPKINSEIAASILSNVSLPTAAEKIDNLVLYLGESLKEPGVGTDIEASFMRAKFGCVSGSAAEWILTQAVNLGLVQGNPQAYVDAPFELLDATLSLQGWKHFYSLQRAHSNAKRGFMAMKFGDAELDVVFRDVFKVAAKRAGFSLSRLDESPRAGLIDDRLRLEIRSSRFLIADLSHQNAGAYWEAGYAEGLGNPVIYTCRKDVFDDPDKKPHFDTNHHLTIVWDPQNLKKAEDELATTIRVTLPEDAKLSD